ncbi:hypothetical protein [Luteibacter aegosomatissinici]|uniref:hypothetical protein n=1 Tax=Luteibacter aegosomatissinici TaxID=2911539 RepID=UPI001FF8A697|nr:hypothetical protein [Luteibacter aegosomatissinici]UPG92796.1 hypothetical protein L2Y97_13070 [Luteibacter aegosomatissinici]
MGIRLTRRPSGFFSPPPPEVLTAYFSELGYALVHNPQATFDHWVVSRPNARLKAQSFSDYGGLWVWWLEESLRILNADTEYRLLCSWYRTALPDERVEILQRAREDCALNHPAAKSLRPCGFQRLAYCELKIADLDDTWLETVAAIEAECRASGARSSERLCIYIDRYTQLQARQALSDAISAANAPTSPRRRL